MYRFLRNELHSLRAGWRTLVLLFLLFIGFTVVGTLTHELGHCAVAVSLGHRVTLHYGSMNYDRDTAFNRTMEAYWDEHKHRIKYEPYSDERKTWYRFLQAYNQHGLAIALGGPLQTMLTGTIGLIFVILYRKRFRAATRLSVGQWLLVLTALFWLRQTSNLMQGWINQLLTGRYGYSDEIGIARHLRLPDAFLTTSTAAIGLLVLVYLTFRIIPRQQRVVFLTAGLLGGLTGFYLWLIRFGPVLLP